MSNDTQNPIYRAAYDAVCDTLAGRRQIAGKVEQTIAASGTVLRVAKPAKAKRGKRAAPAPVAAAPTKRAATPKAKRTRVATKTGAKRPAALVEKLQGKIASYLSSHTNANIESIAKATHQTSAALALPMKKLLGAKRVTKTGEKRATRYSLAGVASAAKPKASKNTANGVAEKVHPVESAPAPAN